METLIRILVLVPVFCFALVLGIWACGLIDKLLSSKKD